MEPASLVYRLPGFRNLGELTDYLDELWADDSFWKSAADLGFDREGLPSSRTGAFNVHRQGAGLDPASTAIVVAFAPVAAKMVRDLWTKVILPRIERDKGVGALQNVDDRK